jgi:hypothetical protein
LTDADTLVLAGGQVRVTIAINSSSDDRLSIAAGTVFSAAGNSVLYKLTSGLSLVLGTFSGGANGSSLLIELNQNATVARVEELIRAIRYRSESQNPSTLRRTIRFDVTDGDGAKSATRQVQVDAVRRNDAPVLDSNHNTGFPLIHEDATAPAGGSVSDMIGGTITDPDDSLLRGIAVTTAANYWGQWQYSLNAGSTWQAMGEVSSSAARLLPGWARVRFLPNADFNGTVTLFYRAWDQTQGSAGGTFDLAGNTGGTGAFSTAYQGAQLRVLAVNDPPKLALGGTLGYVLGSPAITLAAGALVSDVDSANFGGGRLQVGITDGASAPNRLGIGSGFTVTADNDVLHGTTFIGKQVSNGVGTGGLLINFYSSARAALVQQLVRSITFKTIGGATGQRKVVWTISDGDGGSSFDAVKKVNVS